MNLRVALVNLLQGDLLRWQGLPTSSVSDFDALFGAPIETSDAVLGATPAERRRYRIASGQHLTLWSRRGEAVMVEPSTVPSLSVLDVLPKPSAVLPHEITVPDAYAHEYLYCGTGLVLTVAQAFDSGTDRIVRCRGIRRLADPAEFGADYYLAFEDRVHWGGSCCGDGGAL